MRTLRRGSTGPDVQAWLNFLRGRDFYPDETDSVFGPKAEAATKAFQERYKLGADGVVGPQTYARAMQLGFSLVEDDDGSKAGPNWPPQPDLEPLIGNEARAAVFGKFRYRPAGTKGNPEAIRILDDWQAKNIVKVEIPQLVGLKGAGGAKSFWFHRLCARQIQAFFEAVEKVGLAHLLLTWGGSYVPRFIRGSRSVLSNHSFGSAFDINVPWNYMGSVPALVGKKGSVREIVELAAKFGLFWGGYFRRKDGMHFEVARPMSNEEVEEVLRSVDSAA